MFNCDFTLMKDLLVGEKSFLIFLLALTLVFGRFGVSNISQLMNRILRCVIGLAVPPDVAEGGLGSLPLLLGQGSLGVTSCGRGRWLIAYTRESMVISWHLNHQFPQINNRADQTCNYTT